MRVLLLNPPSKSMGSRDGRCQTEGAAWLDAFPPTTFASIAGCVREKYDLLVLDCIGSRMSYEDAVRQSVNYSPDYMILNTTTPTIQTDLEIAHRIKDACGCRIIAYGENVTARYKELLNEGSIDYAILSEPETPVMKILEGTQSVPGVAMKGWDGGKWMEPDLDALPFPAYDLLPPYYYPLTGERWMFVRTGRGCPFKCIYCIEPIMSPKPRFHSVEYLIRQFKWLVNTLDIRLFMFWDEVATLDKQRMIELCGRIREENLRFNWFCTTRVDRFDEELAKHMSDAGCRMLAFGFESGNQEVLDKNRKGITLEQSRKAVLAAKKYGMRIIGHFIIGLIGDTPETARKTAKFARDLRIDFAQFYVATPFPSSELYKTAKENGWLAKTDMRKMDQGTATLSYPNFTAEQMQKERRSAYIKFYLRPHSIYTNLTARPLKKIIELPFQTLNFSKWALK